MGRRKKNKSKPSLKRCYVVWVGHRAGLFDRWSEAKKQVDGYAGAKFKGFPNRALAARAYADGWEKHWGTGRVLPPSRERKRPAKPLAMPQVVICPTCNETTKFVTGADVYPGRSDLATKRFYVCRKCDSRVGTHPDGAPLGSLAGPMLRAMRIQAHAVFDTLWKDGGMDRKEAYAWLASSLGVDRGNCHIGQFDESQCEAVIEAVSLLSADVTYDVSEGIATDAPY